MLASVFLLAVLASLGLADSLPKRQESSNTPVLTNQPVFSNPVQPTAFSDDPALSSTGTLSIATPAVTGTESATVPLVTESGTGSSSSNTEASGQSSETTSSSAAPPLVSLTGSRTETTSKSTSSTSNPAAMPTAFANAAVGLVAVVGLAVAL